MKRTVTQAETDAYGRLQRIALQVRIGEATQEEYVTARREWMLIRGLALSAEINKRH